MKFTATLGAVAATLALGVNAQGCSQTIVRKEIRNVSPDEWSYYSYALYRMNKNGWFAWYSSIHDRNAGDIHGVAVFLPWHREFANQFELTARQFYPYFALPYWDAARDFSFPIASPVLTYKYLGGDGNRANNGCVTNGPQVGWTMGYPNNACLHRRFSNGDGTIPSWQSPEDVTRLIQTSSSFGAFAPGLEGGIHAAVHNGIGGDMATMWSPNDVAFFLHHANIDRIWWKWQNSRSGNMYSYSGRNSNGSSAQLSDNIPVFGGSVQSKMVVGQNSYCYSYDDNGSLSKRDEMVPSTNTPVISNPQMNLATALSYSLLQKYFPLLADSSPANTNSVDLPNGVSQKATQFANAAAKIIEDIVNNSHHASSHSSASASAPSAYAVSLAASSSNANNSTAVKVPVVSDTIASSTVATANSVNLEAPPVAAAANSSSSDLSQLTSNYKMPYPARIPEHWLTMHGIDLAVYEAEYQKSIQFVDDLNNAGYVSPYI
ncbi:Tyrosinase [Zancudomyces culisetae]|uniref:Tyrosinase n=1 Tax=Zancudomyces culisetae TaxID=1213189 RepID=A0A1R1PJS5_ZANCU|nr:Tyrosinase [Zancudomyces culisetae]|eukprot:OMH81218.1 Tyrosinase [Zancudomyces culisetae]